MDYSNYLFRVSSLGHIMTGATFYSDAYEKAKDKELEAFRNYDAAPDGTKEKTKYESAYYAQRNIVETLKPNKDRVDLGETCKTHLMDVWIANEFGRSTKDIRSKYIQKGIEMEDAGLVAYGIVKGWIPEKCTERRDDGFIMGEIDFWKDDTIYDNKSSWDIWTFYRNIKYMDNPRSCVYYPNMQGYMKLWDKPKSKVVYTLLDTPERLIEKEIRYLESDFIGNKEMLEEAVAELRKNLTYSDIPLDRRVIEISIDRDEKYIANIQNTVKACRVYLNNIKHTYYEMDSE